MSLQAVRPPHGVREPNVKRDWIFFAKLIFRELHRKLQVVSAMDHNIIQTRTAIFVLHQTKFKAPKYIAESITLLLKSSEACQLVNTKIRTRRGRM